MNFGKHFRLQEENVTFSTSFLIHLSQSVNYASKIVSAMKHTTAAAEPSTAQL
jgi:hypothetical protein